MAFVYLAFACACKLILGFSWDLASLKEMCSTGAWNLSTLGRVIGSLLLRERRTTRVIIASSFAASPLALLRKKR